MSHLGEQLKFQLRGHEFGRIVVELGSTGVTSVKVGDIASGEGHIVCGLCRNCRWKTSFGFMNTVGIGVNRDGAFARNTYVFQKQMCFDPGVKSRLLSDL
jgi:threonine 3-dehydrogenase